MIDDCCNTVSLSDFGYGAPADGPAAQPGVYQFSYPYTDADHPDESVYGNSGMMYIVLLSDGKVVIIDGGEYKHSTNRNTAELYRFLRELTGRDDSSPIEIAMWYCTHCHSDHMYLFNKLLHGCFAPVIWVLLRGLSAAFESLTVPVRHRDKDLIIHQDMRDAKENRVEKTVKYYNGCAFSCAYIRLFKKTPYRRCR